MSAALAERLWIGAALLVALLAAELVFIPALPVIVERISS